MRKISTLMRKISTFEPLTQKVEKEYNKELGSQIGDRGT